MSPRSSSMVVVCLREPLMRIVSSANLWLEKLFGTSDSVVVSVAFFCKWFDEA